MRKELSKEEGQRKKFKALFSRLGSRKNYNGFSEETVLLKRIVDVETNVTVADHLWFAYTKGFQAISLSENTEIEFEARVKGYKKGYVNKRYGINNQTRDYKLSHPTKIKYCKE